MGQTRIELNGRLARPPILSVTPSGRPVPRLVVDCGVDPDPLLLDVVLVDEAARELARDLAAGQKIRATGTLRAVRRAMASPRIEVMAHAVASAASIGADLVSGLIDRGKPFPAKV